MEEVALTISDNRIVSRCGFNPNNTTICSFIVWCILRSLNAGATSHYIHFIMRGRSFWSLESCGWISFRILLQKSAWKARWTNCFSFTIEHGKHWWLGKFSKFWWQLRRIIEEQMSYSAVYWIRLCLYMGWSDNSGKQKNDEYAHKALQMTSVPIDEYERTRKLVLQSHSYPPS